MSELKSLRRWFRVGDRVRLTKIAVKMGLQGRATSPTGTVIRVLDGHRISVLRDGIKNPDWWSTMLWRSDPNA